MIVTHYNVMTICWNVHIIPLVIICLPVHKNALLLLKMECVYLSAPHQIFKLMESVFKFVMLIAIGMEIAALIIVKAIFSLESQWFALTLFQKDIITLKLMVIC